jgi:EF hand
MQPKLIATLVFASLVGLPLSAAAADKGGGIGPGAGDKAGAGAVPSDSAPKAGGMRSEAPKGPGGTLPESKGDLPAPKGAGALNFNRLDRNNDGFISSDEAKGSDVNAARFKELDKDGDGKISREEAGGQMPGTPGGVSGTKR